MVVEKLAPESGFQGAVIGVVGMDDVGVVVVAVSE